MARAPFLSLSPDLDLQQGMAAIERERLGQQQGMERFGSDMDTRLQGIYGQLIGAQQQGVGTTQGIYNQGTAGIANAYQGGGDAASGAAAQVQQSLRDMAQKLGLDERAVAEVSGRLQEQATGYTYRNQASMMDRIGTMQQLGASMAGVMQMGVRAAQQAMAQGRQDIARRVATEIQRVNTMAAAARSDFTGIKADQTRRAVMEAQKEMMQAQAELQREARASAREARSAARARSGGSPYAAADQAMQEARFEAWLEDRSAPHPFDAYYNEISAPGRFGPQAMSYIDARMGGMSAKDAEKRFKTPKGKTLDTNALESALGRLKSRR